MRMRPRGSRTRLTFAIGVLAVALVLLGGGAAAAADEPPTGAAGWESLLGNRPSPQLGSRWIVVLDEPSLATRVAAVGGAATEEQEKAWTRGARQAQREVIGRLALQGVPIEPEHSYYRTFNGFAAPFDARALAIVVKSPDVRGVYAVRAAIPAAVDFERGRPAALERRRAEGRYSAARFLGRGSDGCPPRHRCRSGPPVHSASAVAGSRRSRPGWRRECASEPNFSGKAGASRDGDGGAPCRLRRPGGA